MTTTGKRPVASDAFLPSGAFDNFYQNNGNSNLPSPAAHPSILSPQTNDLLPLSFSPPSGHLPPSISRYLSSPTKTHRQTPQLQRIPQSTSTPSHLDVVPNATASLYRSVSADATIPPPHATPNHALVQRLAQQNTLIREAWEAERNYLEVNRRRAEEVYQEERVIMEEVREAWENEKAALLTENQTLKERIQRLEGENATLRAVASQGVQATGVLSPLASQRGGSTDASVESGPSGHIAPVADPSSLPPGLDGASRRPYHVLSTGGGSRGTSPLGQPESSPFIPLDPRMQPQTNDGKDFLKESLTGSQGNEEKNNDSIPVIDIQDVDPKLEGITLKASAAQRYYNFGESNKGSPATSPPTTTDAANPRQEFTKRHSSKDQTIQVLKAEESRRLTMHAGHTPNHSLSLFPTMSVADSTGADTQEDGTGPTPSAPPEEEDEQPPETDDKGKGKADEVVEEHHLEANEVVIDSEEPEEQFEPADDVQLKGPLMIKNIPAQDDIFWSQVNKKLEESISHGDDVLPTVMRASVSEKEAGPSGLQHHAQQVAVGGDGHHDQKSGFEDRGENATGEKGIEGDFPLKLKSTTNFGAPFGKA